MEIHLHHRRVQADQNDHTVEQDSVNNYYLLGTSKERQLLLQQQVRQSPSTEAEKGEEEEASVGGGVSCGGGGGGGGGGSGGFGLANSGRSGRLPSQSLLQASTDHKGAAFSEDNEFLVVNVFVHVNDSTPESEPLAKLWRYFLSNASSSTTTAAAASSNNIGGGGGGQAGKEKGKGTAAEDEDRATSTLTFNPIFLLPRDYKDADFAMYQGSSTVPPCMEEMQWIVMQGVTEASSSQLEAYQQALIHQLGLPEAHNARELQSRHSRKVQYTTRERREARLAALVFVVTFFVLLAVLVTCRQVQREQLADHASPERKRAPARVFRNSA